MRRYIPKYFEAFEFVSRKVFNRLGTRRAFMQMDARLLFSVDTLREMLTELTPNDTSKASLTCNNWYWGGKRQSSGLRVRGDQYFNSTSFHSKGCAADLISNHYSADFLRDFIIKNRKKFPYITRIEDGVNWLHIDTANLAKEAPADDSIMLFSSDGTYRYI